MNIQRLNGLISTINFSPFHETEDCLQLRKIIFQEAVKISSIKPKNQLDIYDESILVFENQYQALNFLANVVRIATEMDRMSNCDITLRMSLCCGDYFIHQDQIYGDAVNLATQLSYSSRQNEVLVCGIDLDDINNFANSRSDIIYNIRDEENKCVSISVIDEDSTLTKINESFLKVTIDDTNKVFKSSRNQKVQIGRTSDCEIEINNDFISRNHATITLNFDTIIIEDHSSNGSYIYFDDREIFLNNDSMSLPNKGHISCGTSMYSSTYSTDIISFQLSDDTH